MSLAPFLYNTAWSKQDLFEAAKRYMTAVLALWRLPLPEFLPTKPPVGGRYGTGGAHFGLYLPQRGASPDTQKNFGRIWVNVDDSSVPVLKSQPRRYSYPGNKTDRTAAGILAHECGHHAWFLRRSHIIKDPLWEIWNDLVLYNKREAITGYEPNVEESFAESMRVFALNPMLLKEGAPRRYIFITRDMRLEPPHKCPWEAILQGAAPSVQEQARKWATKGKKK